MNFQFESRLLAVLISVLPAISLGTIGGGIQIKAMIANETSIGKVSTFETPKGSLVSVSSGATQVEFNGNKTTVIGTNGEVSIGADSCFEKLKAVAQNSDCKNFDPFSNMKHLEKISLALSDESTKCNLDNEQTKIFSSHLNPKEIQQKILNKFDLGRTCSQSQVSDFSEALIKKIEEAKSKFIKNLKENTISNDKISENLEELRYFRSMADPTDNEVKLKLNCNSNAPITGNTINFSSSEKNSWSSLLIENFNQMKGMESFYGAQATTEVGAAKTSLTEKSTTTVTAQNTTSLATAPKASVAEIQQAIRTNSPNSASLISAFASDATERAAKAISAVSPATLKAIGANPAAILALSKAANATTTRYEVTIPKNLSGAGGDRLAKADGPVAAKVANTAQNSAQNTDDDSDSQKSEKSGSNRSPASLKGGGSAGFARPSVVDGTSSGRNIVSNGGPDQSGFDKKTTMANPKSANGAEKTVVGELMDKNKSNEYLKILESTDERLKAQKLALLARLKKDKIRIFDRNLNPLGYDKQDASFVFRQKNDSFERLK